MPGAVPRVPDGMGLLTGQKSWLILRVFDRNGPDTSLCMEIAYQWKRAFKS